MDWREVKDLCHGRNPRVELGLVGDFFGAGCRVVPFDTKAHVVGGVGGSSTPVEDSSRQILGTRRGAAEEHAAATGRFDTTYTLTQAKAAMRRINEDENSEIMASLVE